MVVTDGKKYFAELFHRLNTSRIQNCGIPFLFQKPHRSRLPSPQDPNKETSSAFTIMIFPREGPQKHLLLDLPQRRTPEKVPRSTFHLASDIPTPRHSLPHSPPLTTSYPSPPFPFSVPPSSCTSVRPPAPRKRSKTPVPCPPQCPHSCRRTATPPA